MYELQTPMVTVTKEHFSLATIQNGITNELRSKGVERYTWCAL